MMSYAPEDKPTSSDLPLELTQTAKPFFTPLNLITALLLTAIFAAGIYFRFVGQNWDDFTHLHPDERFLTQVAQDIGGPLRMTGTTADLQMQACLARYPESGGVGPFFDSKCSNWYPKNVGHGLYVYGELPLFVVRIAAEITREVHLAQAKTTLDEGDDIVALNWSGYNGIHLVGRTVSAVTELLSLAVLFLIGCRLYGRWVGLLAVALGAAAVFPIQLSHFWTTDAFTSLPVTLTMYFAIRIKERGRWADFVLVGAAMGAALASRINTLPLFGVIVVAAGIYALPVFDLRVVWIERNRLIMKAFLGLIVAGLMTFITFRFTNPHAFTGGPGLMGVFNIFSSEVESPRAASESGIASQVLRLVFYDPFLDDVYQAQYLTSGLADSPPNHQWASRTPYLFAFQNMVVWGMGIPLGLMGWFGFGLAWWRILRARGDWTKHLLPAVWVLVYFAYMGRLWVMTMRYYMPLYPFLILFAAWALVELVKQAYAARSAQLVQRVWRVAVAGLLVFVVGFTFLWAVMYTNVYRHQLTRVQASNWIFRNLSSALSVTVTPENGPARMVNIPVYSAAPDINYSLYEPGARTVSKLAVTGDPVNQLLIMGLVDPDRAKESKTFWAGIALDPNGLDMVTTGRITGDFSSPSSALGAPYTILFEKPVTLSLERDYYLITWADQRLAITRKNTEAAEFILGNADNPNVTVVRLPDTDAFDPGQASHFVDSQGINALFKVPFAGTFDSVYIPHLLNPFGDERDTQLRVRIVDNTSGIELSAGELKIRANATQSSQFGEPAVIKLDKPIQSAANQSFRVLLNTLDSGLARITGTVIAVEGPWDDPVPTKTCALPPEMEVEDAPPGLFDVVHCEGIDPYGSLYRGLEFYLAAEDDAGKRTILLDTLNETDYITISSNRFYDSLSRIPVRFPLSIAYYEALFSGQLGFDRVKVFNTSYGIGGFNISDQHLPFYDSPPWLNEWEAEEAFHVYDHPAVIIFKKDPARYNPAVVADILNSVPLADNNQVSLNLEDPNVINVIRWGALPATEAPSGLMMDAPLRKTQTEGGTWSEMFNREWAINAQPLLTVIFWWLAILIFGFVAFPILFVLLPGLPDRGYPMAKIAGLLIVAWIAWAGGALKAHTWSQGGLLLILIGMALVAALIIYLRRADFVPYVRRNLRHFLIVEAITLALFVGFLLVRLGNPDLWAQSLGGEKPMNFAYFNAVLKSTVFPPYDPWYAGGYMNYYYFGYVLVGTPTKLLGVMPSVAFNLSVVTLFALTGIGAFSLAFNLTASRYLRGEPDRDRKLKGDQPLVERRRWALRVPAANPYLAGVLAILLCVVLGNLGTPAVIATGISRAGECNTLPTDLYEYKRQIFERENLRQPDFDEDLKLREDAENAPISERINFSVNAARGSFECMLRGIGQVISSGYLPATGPDRWFWAPRSIVSEIPGYSNEINEFPYFTFIFGDLHAHMLALPITYLVLGWLLAEIMIAGTRRPVWVVIGATALGGLGIGILLATNTWDWITYLILGLVGTGFAILLHRPKFDRKTLVGAGAQIALLYVAQSIAMLPFSAFFATAYSAVKSFQGNKTPIWAYFTMHGVFLFVIISLLVWQSSRLMRSLYVRDFLRRAWVIRLMLLVLGLTLIAAGVMSSVNLQIFLFDLPIPLAIILLPLIVWCAVLILLPDQPREWVVVLVMIGVGLAISLGVEVVVLDGDIGRQNTFFKFYMQVWMLFAVASGVGLAWLIAASRRWWGVTRVSWMVVLGMLLGTAAMFPVTATQGKNAMRMAPNAPRALDGDAYMEYATYYEGASAVPMANDLKIIHWLQDNVKGTPVILEAHQYPSEYKYNARFAINTGLPSLLGWRFHQQQQRTLDPLPNLVVQRAANVFALYNTTDINTAWRLIRHYEIGYIIVARLEQITYTAEGLAKFDEMVELGLLEVVYEENGDKIYRVDQDAVFKGKLVGVTLQP